MDRTSKESIKMIVRKNAHFKGTIDTHSSVEISGFFDGKILSAKNVYIGPNAKIDGDIEAESVLIHGNVKGNIIAKVKIHLASTSKLEGHMMAKNLIIDKGAVFQGNCKHTKVMAAS